MGYKYAMEYLKKLSELFNPPVLRFEEPFETEKNVISFEEASKFIKETAGKFDYYYKRNSNENIKKSWFYLKHHAIIADMTAKCFKLKASGDKENMNLQKEELFNYVKAHELELMEVFDAFEFINTIGNILRR